MKYALIIANTEYTDPTLAKLSAPGRDAEDFARVLKDKDIGGFDKVQILFNQPEAAARESIDELFDQKKTDDLLVLYFSGHGIRDEAGALYLAVTNTNHTRLRLTAIKSDFIRESMDQSRSRKQVIILDCCNSGAFAHGTKAITGGSIGTASAFEGTGYGRIVLTASDSTQFAWEGDKIIGETENSLFTHFLVKGLESEADLDGDGRITVDELFDYAYEQIVMHTPKQTPGKWSYKQQGEIVLRQFTRLENVKSISLPDELIEAIDDYRAFVREGAVKQLEKLLGGKNLGLARSAREALEKMASEDDSRKVQQIAAQALGVTHQPGQKPEPQVEEEESKPFRPPKEEPNFVSKAMALFISLIKSRRAIIIPAAIILFVCSMSLVVFPAITKSDISSTPISPGISNLYIPFFSADEDVYVYFSPDQISSGQNFESRWFLKANVLWGEVYFPIGHLKYTSDRDNRIFFHLNNPGIVGEYRVDIYADQDLVGTQTFNIYPREQ